MTVQEKGNGEAALSQVRQRRRQLAEQSRVEQAPRQATAVFNDAKRRIDERRLDEAIALLRNYVVDAHAIHKAEAQSLLTEAEIAVSDMLTLEALAAMNDGAFDRLKATGTIIDGKVTHPVLVALRNETVQRNLDKAIQQRETIGVAEKQRREAEQEAERLVSQRREEIRVAEEKRREAERIAVSERRRNNEFNIGDVPFSTTLTNFKQLYPNAIKSDEGDPTIGTGQAR